MDNGFLVESALDVLGGGARRCLMDEMQRRFGLGSFLFVNRCDMSFFHAFSFSVSSPFFAIDTLSGDCCRMAKITISYMV